METADTVLDTFLGIAIVLGIIKAVTKKNYRHIRSQELDSSSVIHAFRRIQRP